MSKEHREGRPRDGYKRAYDLAALFLAHLLLLPLWLLVWAVVVAMVRLQDGGPVFYVQERLGRHGRRFRMYKFRTMMVDAERGRGPVRAVRGDDRVTPFGRWLRATHLDELPQVLNILRGEMSIVGPRPERPELAEQFARSLPDWHRRTAVLPGVASPSMFHGDAYSEPAERLRHDLAYMERMGPLLDTAMIVCCAWATLRRLPRELSAFRRSRSDARQKAVE